MCSQPCSVRYFYGHEQVNGSGKKRRRLYDHYNLATSDSGKELAIFLKSQPASSLKCPGTDQIRRPGLANKRTCNAGHVTWSRTIKLIFVGCQLTTEFFRIDVNVLDAYHESSLGTKGDIRWPSFQGTLWSLSTANSPPKLDGHEANEGRRSVNRPAHVISWAEMRGPVVHSCPQSTLENVPSVNIWEERKKRFLRRLALHSSKLRSSRQEPVRRYLLATHPRPKKTRFRKDGRIAGMRKSGRGRVGDKDFREEMGDEETKTGGEAARRIRESDRASRLYSHYPTTCFPLMIQGNPLSIMPWAETVASKRIQSLNEVFVTLNYGQPSVNVPCDNMRGWLKWEDGREKAGSDERVSSPKPLRSHLYSS
ncbi:hypothetical protein RRG08_062135 [Elysia crispata]|uniref:Uncharacterized protein n=1 Tax=Elysia crispata TaxID=231223 RepID=A0AAE0YMZ6_9GAST|nr:hypothetical protein RRG08_062135 [Elysia crispata]